MVVRLASLLIACLSLVGEPHAISDNPWPEGQNSAAAKLEGEGRVDDALPPGAIARLGNLRPKAEPVFENNLGPVSLSFSLDGKRLASTLWHGESATWDMTTGRQVTRINARMDLRGQVIGWSPDLAVVAVEKEHKGYLLDRATGKALCTFAEILFSDSSGPAFSIDGSLAGFPIYANGKTITAISDVKTGTTFSDLHDIPWRSGPLLGKVSSSTCRPMTHIALSPDRKLLAYSAIDGTVQIVKFKSGRHVRQLGSPQPNSEPRIPAVVLAYSPNGQFLVQWNSKNQSVHFWDIEKSRLVWSVFADQQAGAHIQSPHKDGEAPRTGVCMAFTPDSRMLALGGHSSDFSIDLIETATGKVRRNMAGHQADVMALVVSPDGSLLASGSNDQTVLIWDLWSSKGRN
jgi:WD40 repeat protein